MKDKKARPLVGVSDLTLWNGCQAGHLAHTKTCAAYAYRFCTGISAEEK